MFSFKPFISNFHLLNIFFFCFSILNKSNCALIFLNKRIVLQLRYYGYRPRKPCCLENLQGTSCSENGCHCARYEIIFIYDFSKRKIFNTLLPSNVFVQLIFILLTILMPLRKAFIYREDATAYSTYYDR